ncbi:MarR family winged helix-turn-helix transcriptional regulator [Paenibacillus bouchesdurhonensis]|uniref:MarR family winged helix-turn-helix transcriptional regulator n=1 Tax=Paenibacillus bouchesdurhonensis TaxID=1870990 RepID=UPI000DA62CA9|nr:MarR family transcriptional regulator [Paenibacillus bouchesdurhonensis]
MISGYMSRFVVGYAKMLEDDLTAPQYLIIQILAENELKSCSELADELDVTLPAITNLSKKLVNKGYIERITPDTDRRSVYLRLTEQGREVMARMLGRYRELTKPIWDSLTEQELDTLLSAHEKITNLLPIGKIGKKL